MAGNADQTLAVNSVYLKTKKCQEKDIHNNYSGNKNRQLAAHH
jgi:hypothetical protein